MSNQKQYAERDIMQLDEDGGYYFRHVDAMTSESLHSKSDIAAELGHRDKLIDTYRAMCVELLETTMKLRFISGRTTTAIDESITKAEKALGEQK